MGPSISAEKFQSPTFDTIYVGIPWPVGGERPGRVHSCVGLVRGNYAVIFVNYYQHKFRPSLYTGSRDRSLSDYPLLCLDERVCLRNGDIKQIGDRLGGCQGEPMRTRRQSIARGS